MKKDTWIIVANSSHAKIFKAENNQHLIQIQTLEHPESRLHDSELVSDESGRTFNSTGFGRSSIEYKTDPKEMEFTQFAKEICRFLDTAREKGTLGRLYLTAGPNFLGILRQHISPLTDHLVAGQVDRDLTHMRPEEIRKHLPLVL